MSYMIDVCGDIQDYRDGHGEDDLDDWHGLYDLN